MLSLKLNYQIMNILSCPLMMFRCFVVFCANINVSFRDVNDVIIKHVLKLMQWKRPGKKPFHRKKELMDENIAKVLGVSEDEIIPTSGHSEPLSSEFYSENVTGNALQTESSRKQGFLSTFLEFVNDGKYVLFTDIFDIVTCIIEFLCFLMLSTFFRKEGGGRGIIVVRRNLLKNVITIFWGGGGIIKVPKKALKNIFK